MDHRSLRLREVLELIVDAEAYWGDRIADPDVEGREKYRELLRERDDVQASLQEDIERIGALGVVLKDYMQGLVDFYGKLDGREIFWCWKQGEERIEHWHDLEAGYAGRQPVPEVVRG